MVRSIEEREVRLECACCHSVIERLDGMVILTVRGKIVRVCSDKCAANYNIEAYE